MRRRYKKEMKRKISVKLEMKWRDVLKQAENIRKDPEDMKSLDNTPLEWTEEQLSVLSKGQKFVPAPKRVNLADKYDDFTEVARKLRLGMYFHRKRKKSPVNDEAGEGIEGEFGSEGEPWKSKSAFDPDPGDSDSLEEFLNEVQSRILDSRKRKRVVDNLTPGERQALRKLSSWNKDPKNPRVIRIQNKGSRFVVDWRNRYVNKTLQYV